ncbi:MAG: DNA-binding response regulator, partial [Chloroflexi bacterium RBG_16_57_9]
MSKILLVEDDPTLLDTLEYNLVKDGYAVVRASNGEMALDVARREQPDLVVLDLMLPVLDGLSVCRILRREQPGVAVIMLTARTGEIDKIVGLESGADDYMTKPFSLGEFLARVRAVLRRAPSQPGTRLTSGDLMLDLMARRAWLGERELGLRHKEFDLLAELMRNPGVVLSRDLLLTRVWGYEFFGDSRTVDVHVRWLREKIEPDPAR